MHRDRAGGGVDLSRPAACGRAGRRRAAAATAWSAAEIGQRDSTALPMVDPTRWRSASTWCRPEVGGQQRSVRVVPSSAIHDLLEAHDVGRLGGEDRVMAAWRASHGPLRPHTFHVRIRGTPPSWHAGLCPSSARPARLVDAWWRAANYLAVGQIYLLDNPLLREPLRPEHIKPRLLGHWGTTPGLNLLYSHLNRVIRRARRRRRVRDGPRPRWAGRHRQRLAGGHVVGGVLRRRPRRGRHAPAVPPVLVPRWRPQPRGAEVPGSFHEGGELGYSLAHAYGAAFDNPDLVVACIVGDGEAETGPLAASWHGNKFLDPAATAPCCRSCT